MPVRIGRAANRTTSRAGASAMCVTLCTPDADATTMRPSPCRWASGTMFSMPSRTSSGAPCPRRLSRSDRHASSANWAAFSLPAGVAISTVTNGPGTVARALRSSIGTLTRGMTPEVSTHWYFPTWRRSNRQRSAGRASSIHIGDDLAAGELPARAGATERVHIPARELHNGPGVGVAQIQVIRLGVGLVGAVDTHPQRRVDMARRRPRPLHPGGSVLLDPRQHGGVALEAAATRALPHTVLHPQVALLLQVAVVGQMTEPGHQVPDLALCA